MVKINKQWKRIVAMVVAVASVVAMAAIIDGWSALSLVFLREGVYRRLCDDGQTTCESQQLRLSLVFTVGTVVLQASSLPIGLFLDQFGPRITTIVGTFVFACGLLLLGLAEPDVDLYIPGFALICIGGPCVYFSALVMGAHLWPQRPATITSILSSAVDTSTGVFLVFEVINLYTGLKSSTFFFIYLIGPLVLFVLAVLLWPSVNEVEDDPVLAARVRRNSFDTDRSDRSEDTVPMPSSLDDRFEDTMRSLRISPAPVVAPGFGNENNNNNNNNNTDNNNNSGNAIRVKKKVKKTKKNGEADTPEPVDPSKPSPVSSSHSKKKKKKSARGNEHKRNKTSSFLDAVKPSKDQSPARLKEVSFHLDMNKVGESAEVDRDPSHLVRSPLSGRVIFKTTAETTKNQILSIEYWTMLAYITPSIVFANFYLSTIPIRLAQHTSDQDDINWLTRAFGIVLPCSLLAAPFIGFLLDRRGHITALTVVQVSSLVKCILQLIPNVWLQIATFIAFACWRAFFYSVYIAILVDVFGRAHFGTLFGTQMVIVAIANSLVFLLAYLVIDLSAGNFLVADIVELCISFVSFAFPIYWRVGQHKRYLREQDLDEMEREDGEALEMDDDLYYTMDK